MFNILKYFIAYLFIGLAIGSYYPILTSYLEEHLHLSGKQIGLIIAVNTLISIVVIPIWGMITDLIKSPKKTLLVSVFFSTGLIYLLSYVQTFEMFFFIMILFMMFRAPIFSLYDEIVIGFCQKEQINYGTLRIGGSLGFSISLFFGLFFSRIYGSQVQFILSAIFFFIVWVLLIFIKDVFYHDKEQINLRVDIPILFKNKFYLYIIILFAITFGALETNMAYLGNYLENISQTNRFVPLAIFLSASIEIPILFYTKYLYRVLSIKTILIFINLINVLRFFILFLFPSYQMILILAPIHGITFGLGSPILIQFISNQVRKTVLATSYALYASSLALSTAIMSYIHGYLKDVFPHHINYLFILYLIIFLFNLLLIVRLLKKMDYTVKPV